MYRSDVTEGWIRDCQTMSQTISHEVRRRKAAEREVARLRDELELWKRRAGAAEEASAAAVTTEAAPAGVRRVA